MKRLLASHPFAADFGFLFLRVAVGTAMLTHGWPKVMNYTSRSGSFADPYGFGSEVSMALTIFAEVVCSGLVILGLFTRLALIPLIITMATVTFVVLADDPFVKKEIAALYLIIFTTLFFTGPGKFSFDGRRN
jgi:putative oxidoreductase